MGCSQSADQQQASPAPLLPPAAAEEAPPMRPLAPAATEEAPAPPPPAEKLSPEAPAPPPPAEKLSPEAAAALAQSVKNLELRARVEEALSVDPHHPELLSNLQRATSKAEGRSLGWGRVLDHVVEKHAEEWRAKSPEGWEKDLQESDGSHFKAFQNSCASTLQLVCSLQTVCNLAVEIAKKFAPERLRVTSSQGSRDFELKGLDDEARTVYKAEGLPEEEAYLRWHKIRIENEDRGGHWSLQTNRDGTRPGVCRLDSALVTDYGTWEPVGDSGVQSVEVRPAAEAFVPYQLVMELREVAMRSAQAAGPGRASGAVEGAAEQVRSSVESLFIEDKMLAEQCYQLLSALCRVSRELGLMTPGGENGKGSYVLDPQGKSPKDIFQTLVALSRLADAEVLEKLQQRLPLYEGQDDKKRCLLTQCKILNCRLVDLSDIRDPRESFLPRLLHRMCLWSWQEMHPKQVTLLNLDRCSSSPCQERELAPREGKVRFVVVSDTHGWDKDMELPEGDVLLHCGDLLFEAGHLGAEGQLPPDLEAAVELLGTSQYQSYQWIVMVCGNHDQPLYDLWLRDEQRLYELLPSNVVLLQAHREFGEGARLPSSGAASHEEVRGCVEDGAIWIEPVLGADETVRLKVNRPSDKKGGSQGWVIAGSGVSLANHGWSANRSFQLAAAGDSKQEAVLQAAAKALVRHEPYIVMSHGPPRSREGDQADWGGCNGDKALRDELDGCKSWKVALFGHVHERYGAYATPDGRLFVNAANSTSLYVPSRPPMVFDLGVRSRSKLVHDANAQTPLIGKIVSKVVMHLSPRRKTSKEENGSRELRLCCESSEDLVANWVPSSFVAPKVLEFLKKKQEEAAEQGKPREAVRLSEFDVCGPAVMFGFRSLSPWAFALGISFLTYFLSGNHAECSSEDKKASPNGRELRGSPGCGAFLSYPVWLWCFFVLIFLFTWDVQMRCLSYVVLPQVQLLGRGFRVFERRVSFRIWQCFAFVISFVTLMDVTSQCMFYGQFLRSVVETPRISEIWEKTVRQSGEAWVPGFSKIVLLFTVCWAMMFLQAIYMILHMVADEAEGVDYSFQSMRQGYATLASDIWAVRIDDTANERQGKDEERGCCSCFRRKGEKSPHQRPRLKYRHADILRILAVYGRMPALLMNDQDLIVARLDKEIEQDNSVRYLQILFHRLKDHVSRIILLDVFERAFKLEIQVSVFAIEMALSGKSLARNTAAGQMSFAILLSLCSSLNTIWQNINDWWSFYSMSYAPEAPNFLNKRECDRNWKAIRQTLGVYLAAIVVFCLFVVHSAWKFVMAFKCEDSVWNMFSGCAERKWD